jgi:photosystem II stability/assembly factor-like uncharacterized protein
MWTGTILHTEDGGDHWQTQHTIKEVGLSGMYFKDAKSGWITGCNEQGLGWLLHTDDGGSTWTKEELGDIGDSETRFS